MKQTVLKHKELGSLKQISESLWREMELEIKRNGYSDLTLSLEGAYHGIHDIIKFNNVTEKKYVKIINNTTPDSYEENMERFKELNF